MSSSSVSILNMIQQKFSVVDRAIAEALQNQEFEAQIASDEEIAKQMQEMENLFLNPIPDQTNGLNNNTNNNNNNFDVGPIVSQSVPQTGVQNVNNNFNEETEHHHSTDPDHMTYEELESLTEDIGSESRGLSDETISSFLVSIYSKGFFSRKKSQDCVICQLAYKNRQKLMKLPCQHNFHAECITTWLKMNKTCPICKYEILE